MFTSVIDTLRHEKAQAFAAVVGVVLILALLWAIADVAAAQVERAHGRDYGQAQAQALARDCTEHGGGRSRDCTAPDTWSSSGAPGAVMTPVYATYR